MLRLSFVLGTRPEAIKLAPVILEARRRGHRAQVILSGQHRQLAAPLLRFFGIAPDLDLGLMAPGQSLESLSARVLAALGRRGPRFDPDYAVVQGDTTTALMAAYWAFCRKIPVAHVEAGLRTRNLAAPYPEEANRQMIDRIAGVHLAPTAEAVRALRAEAVAPAGIRRVGNTAIDALHYALERLKAGNVPDAELAPRRVSRFIEGKTLILVTAHRRESFGPDLRRICAGMRALADARRDLRLVYCVHPNPMVQRPVVRALGRHPRILLCRPLPYAGFVQLMERASLIMTDSGGIQEEAPSLGKPILVLRRETERPEGVSLGLARLVGSDSREIKTAALEALRRPRRSGAGNPYGDGQASRRIVDFLEKRAEPGTVGARCLEDIDIVGDFA